MMSETLKIELAKPDGMTLMGELQIWEEDPVDPDQIKLGLIIGDKKFEKSADDYFAALAAIREELEPLGLTPKIYGASRNVYPSPMSRSMGAGRKAYKLSIGKHAMTKDLVSIFETGPDLDPTSVKEQKEYYEKWLESLG